MEIQARTLEIFSQIDLADAFLERGVFSLGNEMNFYAKGKVLAQLRLTNVDSEYPFSMKLQQYETESLLTERLNSYNIQVERSSELLHFHEHRDTGIISSLVRHHKTGIVETINSRYLIGCDGAHSLVRKTLGFVFKGTSMNRDWALCDSEIESDIPSAHEPNIFYSPEGTLIMFPMRNKHWRLITDLGPMQPSRKVSEKQFQDLVTRFCKPFSVKLTRIYWLNTFKINERIIRQFSQGNVFLCGDAAHIHSPAGGQGMNTAIQDAYNLAWKIALAHKKLAKPDVILKSYTQERYPVAKQVLKTSSIMIRFMTLTSGTVQWVRQNTIPLILSVPFAHQLIADQLAEVKIQYVPTALTGKHAQHTGIALGSRAPDARLTIFNDTKKIVRLQKFIAETSYFHVLLWLTKKDIQADITRLSTLFAFERYINFSKSFYKKFQYSPKSEAEKAFSKLFQIHMIMSPPLADEEETDLHEISDKSILYLDHANEFRKKYGLSKDHGVLFVIRPDGYISYCCNIAEFQKLDNYFNGFLQPSC